MLWGGCPMVTLPLERMASRVAASLCYATGLGSEMVVNSQVCSSPCMPIKPFDFTANLVFDSAQAQQGIPCCQAQCAVRRLSTRSWQLSWD